MVLNISGSLVWYAKNLKWGVKSPLLQISIVPDKYVVMQPARHVCRAGCIVSFLADFILLYSLGLGTQRKKGDLRACSQKDNRSLRSLHVPWVAFVCLNCFNFWNDTRASCVKI
jgi:hypothetical protein